MPEGRESERSQRHTTHPVQQSVRDTQSNEPVWSNKRVWLFFFFLSQISRARSGTEGQESRSSADSRPLALRNDPAAHLHTPPPSLRCASFQLFEGKTSRGQRLPARRGRSQEKCTGSSRGKLPARSHEGQSEERKKSGQGW